MENIRTADVAVPVAAPTNTKPSIIIPLDERSVLVGFCALLLIVLAFETYQLVQIRSALAQMPPTAVPAAVPAASSGTQDLPTMSGGC